MSLTGLPSDCETRIDSRPWQTLRFARLYVGRTLRSGFLFLFKIGADKKEESALDFL